jgi:hypothetical protein
MLINAFTESLQPEAGNDTVAVSSPVGNLLLGIHCVGEKNARSQATRRQIIPAVFLSTPHQHIVHCLARFCRLHVLVAERARIH